MTSLTDVCWCFLLHRTQTLAVLTYEQLRRPAETFSLTVVSTSWSAHCGRHLLCMSSVPANVTRLPTRCNVVIGWSLNITWYVRLVPWIGHIYWLWLQLLIKLYPIRHFYQYSSIIWLGHIYMDIWCHVFWSTSKEKVFPVRILFEYFSQEVTYFLNLRVPCFINIDPGVTTLLLW